MNDHATTDIKHLKDLNNDGLIDAVEDHFECSDNPELEDTAFSKNRSK